MSQSVEQPVVDQANDRGAAAQEQQQQPPKEFLRFPISAWLSLVGLVALIAIGGYAMYGRFSSGAAPREDLVDVVGRRGMPNWGGPRIRADGIERRRGDRYEIKAGNARLDISRRRDNEDWNFRYRYDPELTTPEQRAAITARFRLPIDAAFAKSLSVTPEQIEQLRKIPARVDMVVSDADQQRIRSLFEAYLKASGARQGESRALVEALREVGQRSLEPTRSSTAEQVKAIQSILTPEQIARFRRPGN